jgi:hypothetical protein
MLATLAAVAAVSMSMLDHPRSTYKLDFGWKFHLGRQSMRIAIALLA